MQRVNLSLQYGERIDSVGIAFGPTELFLEVMAPAAFALLEQRADVGNVLTELFGEAATAARLRRGQKVLVDCTCAGRIMGSPVLKNCAIVDAASAAHLVNLAAAEAGVGAIVLGRSRHRFTRPGPLVPLPLELGPAARTGLWLVCARSALDIARVRAVADLLVAELSHLERL